LEELVESKIEVNTSDYAIAHAPQILTTTGIGSCVAVCLYERQRRMGALLHIMLPRSEGDKMNPLRFADTALSFVLVELQRRDISPDRLTAKLIGGAQMFKAFQDTHTIGERNVAEITHTLQALSVTIEAQEVGGYAGRSLEFDVSTGLVTIYTIAP
jgi:chemotaxis protein CheD